MSLPRPSLHLVGNATGERAEAARIAAKASQLGDLVRQSSNLSAAIAAPQEGLEVLVLIDPTPEDFEIALATLDSRGLPRWAVVPPWPEDIEHAAVWEPPTLAHTFRFAVSLLMLRRDKARLAGDLHTVARRLTHDLRTPLNSISTANEALATNATAPEPGPSLHRAISEAVEETGNLIERVAAVLVAGARPIVKQPIEMEEVIWKARERLDSRIRAARATIRSPEKWPMVNGVPAWLELVWTNLLANSLQHAGETPCIELGWKHTDADFCFWVRDSGAGVAVAKRAHLFYPFDRLNELSAPRGYGLSLVQRLIELQGGATGYSPDPAPSGSFYFTLPMDK
jgi:signal transduction histidine kinase